MPNDDSDDLSGPLDDPGEPLARFLKVLPRILEHEIKSRDLWYAPSCLNGPTKAPDCSHILEDLAQDFVVRWPGFMTKIAARPRFDMPYIRLYVGRFVFELQKKHDKIGYVSFMNVKGAVKQVAEMGTFDVLCKPAGDINNDAVLVASGAEATAARAKEAALHDALSGLDEWHRLIEKWVRSPGLVSRMNTDIQDLLRDCLVGLHGRGIRSFRLGDFVGIVKVAARKGGTREVVATEAGKREAVSRDRPTFGIVVREMFDDERFVAAVSDRIDALKRSDARKNTRRIFEEWVEHARLCPEEPLLTPAEIRQKLDLKKQTFSDAFERLVRIIQEIRKGKPDA